MGTGPFEAREPSLPSDYVVDLSIEPYLGRTGAPSSGWVTYSLQGMRSPSPTFPSIKEHWTAHSIPLMAEVFPSMHFYTSKLGKVPASHPLSLVTHVFARAYMVNRYNAPQDKREVSAYLGKALRAIQTNLNDASRCKEDATLVAVWLLGNYEVSCASLHRLPLVHSLT
jgi:hypothetical protein